MKLRNIQTAELPREIFNVIIALVKPDDFAKMVEILLSS